MTYKPSPAQMLVSEISQLITRVNGGDLELEVDTDTGTLSIYVSGPDGRFKYKPNTHVKLYQLPGQPTFATGGFLNEPETNNINDIVPTQAKKSSTAQSLREWAEPIANGAKHKDGSACYAMPGRHCAQSLHIGNASVLETNDASLMDD